jgi:DNA-directed RNA polymerase specialized sigma24 family protein
LTDQPQKSAALLTLTADQRKKLAALARVKARGAILDEQDLLQGAYARWLKSDSTYGADTVFDFLLGALNSIGSNDRRRRATVRRFEGERLVAASADGPDPVELAQDLGPSQDDAYLREQIYRICDDEEVKTLLLLLDDNATRAEILAETGWDVTKYETVRKRMKKWGASLYKEGIL